MFSLSMISTNVCFRTHAKDDILGLNLRLFVQMQQTVQSLFQMQIEITNTNVSRAIYFHGYLLEQTMKIFDITPLQTSGSVLNQQIGTDLQRILIRQILLLPKIIITKEDLYASNGINNLLLSFCTTV